MNRTLGGSLLALAILSFAGFSRLSPWAQSRAALGSVKGTVRLVSPVPALADIPVNRNQDTCGHLTPDPSLQIGPTGALANAVVTIDVVNMEGQPPPRPTQPARLDQRGCVFIPHVQVVPLGATLEIGNSDPILHNVHAYLGNETLFNLAMPVQNYRIRRSLERPGVIRFKCDAGHTWMSAYIWVSPHKYYAVTGERGDYAIKDIPAGSYELRAWHELAGERKVGLTISAGKTSPLDIELSAPVPSR